MDKFKISTIILSVILLISLIYSGFNYVQLKSLADEKNQMESLLTAYKQEIELQAKRIQGATVCSQSGSPFGPPIGIASKECEDKFVGLYFSCDFDGTPNILGNNICVCDVDCKITISRK